MSYTSTSALPFTARFVRWWTRSTPVQPCVDSYRAMRALPPDAQPVMVGDRKHDIAAAHEHRIRAIGVLWGIGSELELLTAGADALAHTPAELATILAPSG